MRALCAGSIALICLVVAPSAQADDASQPSAKVHDVTLKKENNFVIVRVDGEPFTIYQTDIGPKPILWPIVGADGSKLTRSYPQEDIPSEKHDHPHQRSFWFTHGNVNGIDFWSEQPKHGSIVHREYRKVEAKDHRGTIVTANDWVGTGGRRQLEDERTLTFAALGDDRIVDFDIVLKATSGPVKFGDTKEGSFGVRVPTTMDVDSKLGGQLINSDGLTNDSAWGKPAAWVDYHGPVGGHTLGIAILNHPSSFRYPTTWHVRTYGLFAANPFGWHEFDPKAGKHGDYILESGKSISFRYRVIFHPGDEKQAKIAEKFAAYGKEPRAK